MVCGFSHDSISSTKLAHLLWFNVSSQQRSKGILLGVVGTDVPVKELLKTIPKYKVTHYIINVQDGFTTCQSAKENTSKEALLLSF